MAHALQDDSSYFWPYSECKSDRIYMGCFMSTLTGKVAVLMCRFKLGQKTYLVPTNKVMYYNGQFHLWGVPAGNPGSCIHHLGLCILSWWIQLLRFPAGASESGKWPLKPQETLYYVSGNSGCHLDFNLFILSSHIRFYSTLCVKRRLHKKEKKDSYETLLTCIDG